MTKADAHYGTFAEEAFHSSHCIIEQCRVAGAGGKDDAVGI